MLYGWPSAGSINTIAIKLQDNVVVGEDEQGQPRTFKHPAVQTAFMFAGEVLCLVAFLVGRCWKHLSGKYDEYSQEEKVGWESYLHIPPA